MESYILIYREREKEGIRKKGTSDVNDIDE